MNTSAPNPRRALATCLNVEMLPDLRFPERFAFVFRIGGRRFFSVGIWLRVQSLENVVSYKNFKSAYHLPVFFQILGIDGTACGTKRSVFLFDLFFIPRRFSLFHIFFELAFFLLFFALRHFGFKVIS